MRVLSYISDLARIGEVAATARDISLLYSIRRSYVFAPSAYVSRAYYGRVLVMQILYGNSIPLSRREHEQILLHISCFGNVYCTYTRSSLSGNQERILS